MSSKSMLRPGLNEDEEDTPGPGELQVLLNLKGGVGISLITREGYSQNTKKDLKVVTDL